MAQFLVVYFVETKEVELVSSNWMFQNTCFWPPYKFSKLKKALLSHEKPLDSWESYNARVIGSYSSYNKARKALSKAEETSDLASDIDCGRGKRKKLRTYNSSSSDEESFSGALLRPSSPAPQEVQLLTPISVNTVQLPDPVINPSACSSQASVVADVITHVGESLTRSSTDDLLKTLLREVNVVKAIARSNSDALNSVLEELIALKDARAPVVASMNVAEAFNLPIKTAAEMNRLEKELEENVSSFEALVTTMSTIGGLNFDNCVRRMLRKLLSDSLATNYSWMGTKGKESFCTLHGCKAIFMAVRKNALYRNRLDNEVEVVVKNWLRHAKARAKVPTEGVIF